MMNKEERTRRFEETIRMLNEQGKRSIDKDGACSYRTAEGLRCAVGMWIRCIPDDDVVKVVGTIRGITIRCPKILNDLGLDHSSFDYQTHELTESQKNLSFWLHLQAFHDNYENWNDHGLIEEEVEELREGLVLKGLINDEND